MSYHSAGPDTVPENTALAEVGEPGGIGARSKDPCRVLRVGIAGCGRIAQAHLAAIKKVPNAVVVGVADTNHDSAARLVPSSGQVYRSAVELLSSCELDVLHVLTPPAFHYDCAKAALDVGVPVLVEKPIAFSTEEAADLYRRAERSEVSLCPDFIDLYNPKFQEAISIVESGQLGRVLHVDAHKVIAEGEINGANVRESQGVHWSYDLPGGVLHNHVTHPLYLALYFTGTPTDIRVMARAQGILPQNLTDQLVIQISGQQCTASVFLSLTRNASGSEVRILCEKGVVHVDFDTRLLLVTGLGPTGIVTRGLSAVKMAARLTSQTVTNAARFARGQLRTHAGLEVLVARYYQSLRHSAPPPISRDLALAVATVEETIVKAPGKYRLSLQRRSFSQVNLKHKEKILLTGATGYVGSNVARKLREEGYFVRALVRPLSKLEHFENLGMELIFGDIRNAADVETAADGMDIILHLAAATKGSEGFMLDSAVNGTRNVAAAARAHKIDRVVYVSSMSVYDFAKMRNGDSITESSPLEEHAQSRGFYTLAKRKAEDVALAECGGPDSGWTILRPSFIVGDGRDPSAAMGVRRGSTVLCFSAPRKWLRLVHVDDVSSAILHIIANEGARGQILTVSAPPILLRDYANQCVRKAYPGKTRVIYIPYLGTWALAQASKITHRLLRRGPDLNRRVLAYMYRNVRADSSRLQALTGWQARHNVLQAMKVESGDRI